MNYINKNINKALKSANIKTRPNASPGVWVSFLLPLSIIIALVKNPQILSISYKLTTLASCGIFIANIVILIQCIKYNNFKIGIAHSVASIFTTFLFYTCLHRGIYFSIFSGSFCTYGYYIGLPFLLKKIRLSFTFGEATLITQSIILFLYASIVNIFDKLFGLPPYYKVNIATLILQIGILGFGVIAFITYKIKWFREPVPFYGLTFFIFSFFILLPLHFLMGQSPIVWILHLLTGKFRTVAVILFWIVCTALAFIVINNQIAKGRKANTIVRKVFHLLVVVVYLTGLIDQCTVLYLASGIILVLLLALDILRILNLPPLGHYLQDGFVVFSDEKDAGTLALTPVYLLAGCSLPIWIHPDSCDVTDSAGFNLLPLISGVLSIGIGDTFASAIGSWIGRFKWPGVDKTIEGTIACIFSQIAVVYLLIHTGYVTNNAHNITKAIVAIVAASIVEAKTSQVDNIILPLIMYIILF